MLYLIMVVVMIMIGYALVLFRFCLFLTLFGIKMQIDACRCLINRVTVSRCSHDSGERGAR